MLHRTAYAGREEALRKLAGAQVDLATANSDRDALAARVADLTAQLQGMVPADAAAADRLRADQQAAAAVADSQSIAAQVAALQAQLAASDAGATMARDASSALAGQVSALAAELEGQRRAASEAAHRADAADALAAAERERAAHTAEGAALLHRSLADRADDARVKEEVRGVAGAVGVVPVAEMHVPRRPQEWNLRVADLLHRLEAEQEGRATAEAAAATALSAVKDRIAAADAAAAGATAEMRDMQEQVGLRGRGAWWRAS